MGDDELSCLDLYSTYVSLPTFIRGKVHSRSGSAEGIKRQNARLVAFDERGTWGLHRALAAVPTCFHNQCGRIEHDDQCGNCRE